MDDPTAVEHFHLDPLTWHLDWNLLRTFIVIVQERSITRAGNRLLLSQPAVSAALKRLEDRLETRLINRGGSTFEVTAEGMVLFRQCLEVYGQISQLPANLAAVTRRIKGRITIVLASNTGTSIFDTLLADFHREHPDVVFTVTVASSVNAVQAVMNKTVTAAICYAPAKLHGLRYQHFATMPFGNYCGRSHAFYGCTDLTIDDLQGCDFVSFQPDRLGDDMWPEEIVRLRQRIAPRVVGHSFNLREVYRMVVAGFGIALFPIPAVQPYVARGDLWRLPPADETPSADVYVVTHARGNPTLPESMFLEALRDRIEQTPARERHFIWEPAAALPPD